MAILLNAYDDVQLGNGAPLLTWITVNPYMD